MDESRGQLDEPREQVDEPCGQVRNLPSDELTAVSGSALVDFSGGHIVLDSASLIAGLCFDHVTEEDFSVL